MADSATEAAMGAASDLAGAAAPGALGGLPVEAVVALVVILASVVFFVIAKVLFGKQGGDSVLLMGVRNLESLATAHKRYLASRATKSHCNTYQHNSRLFTPRLTVEVDTKTNPAGPPAAMKCDAL